MHLMSILTASAIGLTLLTQSVSLWHTPRQGQETKLLIASYQSAIREGLSTALHTQSVTAIPLPSSPLTVSVRTLAGDTIVAYPDGTLSPGQIRICGPVTDRVLNLSSLGRIQQKQEPTECELPTQ